MSRKSDWIPRSDSAFDAWFRNLEEYVIEKTSGTYPAWTHIPQTELTTLSLRYEEWHEAYNAYLADNSSARVAAKNQKRAAAETFLRAFVPRFLRCDPVTPEDRAAMGIPEYKTTRSPVPAPDGPPVWSMQSDGLFKVRFDIKLPGAERPRIPEGYDGVMVSYAVTDAPVEDVTQLPLKKRFTKGISRIQFEQADDGKYLSAALMWMTDSNIDGPLSTAQSIKIR